MSATHPYSGLKCFPGLAEFEFADYLSVLKGQTQQAEKSGKISGKLMLFFLFIWTLLQSQHGIFTPFLLFQAEN